MSLPDDEAGRAAQKAFLRACQQGQLETAQSLLREHPHVLDARSASKGYSAMHWGAMGGSMDVIEWLDSLGVDPDDHSPDDVTPIQVALEYKRIEVARRLQVLRDRRRAAMSWRWCCARSTGGSRRPRATCAMRMRASSVL